MESIERGCCFPAQITYIFKTLNSLFGRKTGLPMSLFGWLTLQISVLTLFSFRRLPAQPNRGGVDSLCGSSDLALHYLCRIVILPSYPTVSLMLGLSFRNASWSPIPSLINSGCSLNVYRILKERIRET